MIEIFIMPRLNYSFIFKSCSISIIFKDYVIYDMSGQTVAKGNQKEIATTSLSNGIYILKLQFDKGIVTRKFLK